MHRHAHQRERGGGERERERESGAVGCIRDHFQPSRVT